MMQYNILITAILLAISVSAYGQVKSEREYRIRKEQFPTEASLQMTPYLEEARKIRYYREVDSSRVSYEVKFKKDRLHYSVEFSEAGTLEDVEILIRPVDIPEETFQAILQELENRFTKYAIRRLQQQYPRSAFTDDRETLRKAFQNLLLSEVNYELVVQARTPEGVLSYELLFDSDGVLKAIRKSLPPNYDHVLY